MYDINKTIPGWWKCFGFIISQLTADVRGRNEDDVLEPERFSLCSKLYIKIQ